jgi:hypothetical protein
MWPNLPLVHMVERETSSPDESGLPFSNVGGSSN